MTGYDKFYQLHHQSDPFILANVWNVESARAVERAGFSAMGTSSGAIASSLGYPDGEQIPFQELLYVVKRIKACTNIPLSVDVERGYTDDIATLNQYIQQLLDLGVVGINLEDAQGEGLYLRKLTGIKSFLNKTNQKLFINARTDVFLQKLAEPLQTTINRARLYKEAGADGLFVTAVGDPGLMKEIASSTTLPINVVNASKTISLANLAHCGVKRISMAVLLYKAAYKKVEMMAKEIYEQNSFEPLF